MNRQTRPIAAAGSPRTIYDIAGSVAPADADVRSRARAIWDAIAKPIDGLGRLEEAVCAIAAARGELVRQAGRKAVAVFCADNGVVAQGVTQAPSEVTAVVARNMCRGDAVVSTMAAAAGADVFPVDMGMLEPVDDPRIRLERMGAGTADCSLRPAMSRRRAEDAMLAGARLAMELADKGYGLLAAGEMGIGNTTTSSALACVLLGMTPADTVGPGAGLPPDRLARKVDVVERALAANAPFSDAVDALAKVGGFDIAGIAGFMIGSAAARRPCLVDGFITAVAALVAVEVEPNVRDYLVASHMSSEPATGAAFERLGLAPFIFADMHQGEGTGAVAAMPLLDMAFAVFGGIGTFEDNGIDPYVRYGEGRGR